MFSRTRQLIQEQIKYEIGYVILSEQINKCQNQHTEGGKGRQNHI